jgi:hypothetical protein
MDVAKMLAELREERAQIEEAILTLERLAKGSVGKRRGRPPQWLKEARSRAEAADAKPAAATAPVKQRTSGKP